MLNTGLLSKITGRSRIISGQDYYISIITLKFIKHLRDISSYCVRQRNNANNFI
ncbi:unknown [Acetobacter sp. CAG:267]|nr:unknown [Acetobacter sp. CAG:267]